MFGEIRAVSEMLVTFGAGVAITGERAGGLVMQSLQV